MIAYRLALTRPLVECQFYASGTLSNRIYILDMSNPILNVNDNKKAKRNMKSSYSWHCRLGHASERLMTKLHNYGSLGSFDRESFDTCKSSLLGKDDRVSFYGKG